MILRHFHRIKILFTFVSSLMVLCTMQVMIRDNSQVYLQTYWCFYGGYHDIKISHQKRQNIDKEVFRIFFFIKTIHLFLII